MAAAERFTFDPVVELGTVTTAASRPSVEDVGGARLEDSAEFPPDMGGKMLCKDMGNQWQRQIAAAARMAPSARITIDFLAGVPFIAKLTTLSETLLSSDFTITDTGTGITGISWVAGKLPAVECDPTVSLRDDSSTLALSANVRVLSAVSVQVRTYSAGSLANIRFTIEIH